MAKRFIRKMEQARMRGEKTQQRGEKLQIKQNKIKQATR